MTQTAKVKQILSPEVAMVAVKRVSACAHDCSKCASGGCMMMEHPDITVRAYNGPEAHVGDMVIVESSSKSILSMAAVVYLLPMALLIFGYIMGSLMGLGEGGSFLVGAILFVGSFLISITLNKHVQKNAIQFRITRIVEQF